MNADGSEGPTQERETNQVAAESEKINPFERHQRCINWAGLALNSAAALVVLAGVYVANETLRSINESVIEAGRSAAAAEGALGAARDSVEAQNSLIEYSQRQMDLTLQQIEDARNALWLEQRAWVNHRAFQLQVRDEDGGWSAGDIEEGSEFRIQMFFENVGETPATHTWFNTHSVGLLPIDGESPEGWEGNPRDERSAGAIIMPRGWPDGGAKQSTRRD